MFLGRYDYDHKNMSMLRSALLTVILATVSKAPPHRTQLVECLSVQDYHVQPESLICKIRALKSPEQQLSF